MTDRRFSVALAAFLSIAATVCARAQQATPNQGTVEQLEVETVVGQRYHDMPHLGYQEPEVFDPFTDQLYQGGYRDFPPVEIPLEYKYLTALARTKKLGRILACADGWYYPFSHTAPKADPPGIDIDILRAIAKRSKWEISVTWANTGTRFGAGAAFAKTIDRGYCDIFVGMVITGDDHHMTNHRLTFTRPYVGMGFVLVAKGKAQGAKNLDELRHGNVKVGVPAYSPMHDFVKEKGIPHETYFANFRLIDGLAKGEVDAGMVWAPALTVAKKERGIDLHMVPGYVPAPGQRWNGAWAIQNNQDEFKQFLDTQLGEMLNTGEIKRIVESYGVPFYPPFEEAPMAMAEKR